MKKCIKCGAIQKNERFTCIDCGERLGEPLSEEEEAKADRDITKKINRLSNRADYLTLNITKLDIVIAVMLIVLSIMLLLIKIIFSEHITEDIHVIGNILIVVMILETVDLLLPDISWGLYKLRFIFTVANSDDMEPSELFCIFRRVRIYGICIIGIIVTIVAMVDVI